MPVYPQLPLTGFYISEKVKTVITKSLYSISPRLCQHQHDLPRVKQRMVCDSNQAEYDWQSGWSWPDVDTHRGHAHTRSSVIYTTHTASHRPAEIRYSVCTLETNMSTEQRRSSESIVMNWTVFFFSTNTSGYWVAFTSSSSKCFLYIKRLSSTVVA